jgi:hypothetical protein
MNRLEMRDIMNTAYPQGQWPYELQPMPWLRLRIANLHRKHKQPLKALCTVLLGRLPLERRTGDSWTRNLFHTCQIFEHVLASKGYLNVPPGGLLPDSKDMVAVLLGYLYVLHLGAEETFGNDAAYTKAIKGWYDTCLEGQIGSKPGHRLFSHKLNKAQSKLLRWAKVDNKQGIVLP